MTMQNLQIAISGIAQEYLSESGDFGAVAADFRREKTRKRQRAVSVLCLAAVCAGVIGAGIIRQPGAVMRASAPDSEPAFTAETEAAADLTEPVPSLYDAADVLPFEEWMLSRAIGVVEGEVTESGRSGLGGIGIPMYFYKLRVERVLCGDLTVGEEVTVKAALHSETFECVKPGRRYVVPLVSNEGENRDYGTTRGGYRAVYPFEPMIERVSGGYIVPRGWDSLITDGCTDVTGDPAYHYKDYVGRMYCVPDEIFEVRMQQLIEEYIG